MITGSSRVGSYRFELSDDEWRKNNSHAQVTNTNSTNKSNAQPIFGGIYTPELGAVNEHFNCITCGKGKDKCNGHSGHIDLNIAIVNPIVIIDAKRWANVICFECGKPVVDMQKVRKIPPSRRLIATASTTHMAGKQCPHCAATQPKITRDVKDYFSFIIETESETRTLYPDELLKIFERVSTKTVISFGKNEDAHPRKTIMNILTVPANTVRPATKSFTGVGTNHTDTTNCLQSIIILNNKLKGIKSVINDMPNSLTIENRKHINLLGQAIYDLILGSTSTSQNKKAKRRLTISGTRNLKSLLQEIGKKEGTIRSHILGKRVLSISRSTICGNCKLRVDELGVPISFARTMSVEETVQEYNINYLTTFLLNGRKQYPGCSYIIKKSTGKRYEVNNLGDMTIEIGDVILRDAVTGDIAFATRQPALGQRSINCHYIVVLQDPLILTIQLNVLACPAYNADFDGDQMNIWVVSSVAARIEASVLGHLSNTFIHLQNGSPMNGQTLDSVSGAYALTKSNVVINRYKAMQLFAGVKSMPTFPHDKEFYSGRDIISLLLQDTPINIERRPNSYDPVIAPYVKYKDDEINTIIKNGNMLAGVLDKKTIGEGATGGIFHTVSRIYGPRVAFDLLFEFQHVILNYMDMQCLTFSYGDLVFPKEIKNKIQQITEIPIQAAKQVSDDLINERIIAPFSSDVDTHFKIKHSNELILPDADILQCILEAIDPDENNLYNMVKTGAKGSKANIAHICVAIGTVTINGERISNIFSYGRTMSFFPRFSTDPRSVGYIRRAYIDGLEYDEFYAASMAGRFDLITKALSTSITGESMRNGIMSNQSSITNYLMQAEKGGHIVQLIYAETGLDSKSTEMISFKKFVHMSNKDIEKYYRKEHVKSVINHRDKYRKYVAYIEAIEDTNFVVDYSNRLAFNINQYIDMELNRGSTDDKGDINEKIKLVMDSVYAIPYTLFNEIQESLKTTIPDHFLEASWLHIMHFETTLLERGVLEKLTLMQTVNIIEQVRKKYANALVAYGDAVGVNASHAISAPLTQYMLDSHHRSVAGGTSGSTMKRVKELFGAIKVENEKFPMMTLPLIAGSTEQDAKFVANNIEHMILRQFMMRYDVIFESHEELRYPNFLNDVNWMSEFIINCPLVKVPQKLSKWCIRVELNRTKMIHKSIDLATIIRNIRIAYPLSYVTHSHEASEKIIIRAWMSTSLFKETDDQLIIIRKITPIFLDSTVRGVHNIKSAKVMTIAKQHILSDGTLSTENRHAIITEGTNILKAITFKKVDPKLIRTTSVDETFKIFGINAARNRLSSEISKCIGGSSDMCHIYMYTDEMTRTGRVTNIKRGGVAAREYNNTLLTMAYENTKQYAINAAINSLQCKVYGIAAPMLLGDMPLVGTNYCNISIDEEFVKEKIKSVDSAIDDIF